MKNIGESVSPEQLVGLQKTMNERLIGKNGVWWYNRMIRVLEGAHVGNMLTNLEVLKTGIKIEMPQRPIIGRLETKYEDVLSLFDALKENRIFLSNSVNVLKRFGTFKSYPMPIGITLSRIKKRSGVSAEELCEHVGEDAVMPIKTMILFLQNKLIQGNSYAFVLRNPHGPEFHSFVVQKGQHGWDLGVCPMGQTHPVGTIFVYPDFLSKVNAEIRAGYVESGIEF